MKRGQIKLSFGMIFSVFLVIVFLVFAFYAIRHFLGVQNTIQIEKFVADLQDDVDEIWKSPQAEVEREYWIPKKINSVCFEEEDENLVFVSSEFIAPRTIEHLEISEQVCFDNVDGKVKINLVKDYEDTLVRVENE